MKSFYILSLAFGMISLVPAQDADPDSIPDAEQIQKAIDEFNRNRKAKPAEITVVLPPPGKTEATPDKTEETPRAIAVEEKPTNKKPMLISGKSPEARKEEPAKPLEPESKEKTPDAGAIAEIPAETPAEPISVRVESIRSGSGKIDPNDIEIKSSFTTKALIPAPAGWKLGSEKNAPAFSRQVEIKPGTFISLEITPHILSPDADATKVFSVTEPGYDYKKGYQQDQTVANILESSITQLETDSLKMGSALSELHRLLASLPKPETPASNTNPPIKP
jgi:hypothetical protein